MSRRRELLLIVCMAIAASSTASHLAVGWLGIKAAWGGHREYGSQGRKATGLLHSSSPGYDGIDWDSVASFLDVSIESWATPGSSPSEWEVMHSRSMDARRVFIALSAYDLNEYFLCDFRADILPLRRSIGDLAQVGTDSPLFNRMLTQQAVMTVRHVFPTVGRSDGVMVGVRARLQKFIGYGTNAGETPQFSATGTSVIADRLTDWSDARFQRRLLALRAATGQPSFNGPKKTALLRLLKQAEAQGPVVMLVIPNAPAYGEALMPPSAVQQFEGALADIQFAFPHVTIVRLDQLSALDSNDYFYDLVHMNKYGQQIATRHFLDRLSELHIGPS